MRKKRKKQVGDGPASSVPAVERFRGLLSFPRRTAWGAWGYCVAVTFLLWAPCLVAKEKKVSRVVTGAVLDEADNGIVGATVILTNLRTGEKSATYCQAEGRYQFSDLQPTHDYEVQASYKGISSEARKVSSFDSRNRIVLNLKIPPPSP